MLERIGRDGKTNVHTNIFNTSELTNDIVVVTNLWSAEDFCFADKMPVLDDYRESENEQHGFVSADRLMSKHSITNRYGWLKNAGNMIIKESRVAKSVTTVRHDRTAELNSEGFYYDYNERTNYVLTVTNNGVDVEFNVSALKTDETEHYNDYLWNPLEERWEEAGSGGHSSVQKNSEKRNPQSAEWWIETDVLVREYEDLGMKSPLKKMKVWQFVDMIQYYSSGGQYSSASSDGIVSVSTNARRKVRFMIPVGETTEFMADANISHKVCARLTIPNIGALLSAAKDQISEFPESVDYEKYFPDVLPVPPGQTVRQSPDDEKNNPSTWNYRRAAVSASFSVNDVGTYTVTEYQWETVLDHWGEENQTSEGGN